MLNLTVSALGLRGYLAMNFAPSSFSAWRASATSKAVILSTSPAFSALKWARSAPYAAASAPGAFLARVS